MTNRGNVYRATGDVQRPLADYNEAIRLDAGISTAFASRGSLYHTMRIRLRLLISAKQSGSTRLIPSRGSIVATGEFRRALIDHDEAIRRYPGFTAAFNKSGDRIS